MAKSKTTAPFGVQTERFCQLGFHPALDPSGTMSKNKNKLAPNEYYPKEHDCAYKNVGGERWRRKAIMEEFSENLGFRNAEILEQRRHYKTQGGPGNYELNDDLYKQKSCSVRDNANFGNEERFFQLTENFPAPGTYNRDILKSSCIHKKQMTKLPPFEWDGFKDRFRVASRPWMKAPNRYNPIDHENMEALLKKVVSTKGPYNLFTGPRDGSTIKNHFSPAKKCTPDKSYSWLDGINYMLHHSSRQRSGIFLKEKRFPTHPTVRMLLVGLTTCYRDPNSPGPATYEVKVNSIRKLDKSLHPFNDSVKVVRKSLKWEISPGPGRYNVKEPACKIKHKGGESWIFKSKTGRHEYKAPQYALFD